MLIPSIDLQNGSVVQLVQGEKLAIKADDAEPWIEKFFVRDDGRDVHSGGDWGPMEFTAATPSAPLRNRPGTVTTGMLSPSRQH